MQLIFKNQYIKNCVFSAPKQPQAIFFQSPNVNVNINVEARGLGQDYFEVSLICNAEAIGVPPKATEDQELQSPLTCFILECNFAVVVQLKESENIDDDERQRVLMADVPKYIFPFLREVVAHQTRNGGFSPLLLNIIDFEKMYAENQIKPSDQSIL